MKKMGVITIFFIMTSGSIFCVQFKNNSDLQYTIISGTKCIVLENDRGGELPLQNGNSFIAEYGNKRQKFELMANEKDIELIVLQTDYNHELYAEVHGPEGKPDYREEPVVVP